MHLLQARESERPRARILTLSVRKRTVLHQLLHRDLRKCSASALDACQRCGWTLGADGGYELTAQGRRLAELSEEAPDKRSLELNLS